MPEYITQYEFAELRAQAMIELEDEGRMRPKTKARVAAIKNGEIIVMGEGEVRPLEDVT